MSLINHREKDNFDRFAGALIGLAVGDALGTTLEFKERGSFPAVTDIIGGGPFNLKAGQWTDDTSMALCLAESLIEDGFSLQSQLQKYLEWFNNGYLSSTGKCFDIGSNTLESLKHYELTRELPPEREHAAGNGSLMRLAPVPMCYRNNFEKAVYYSGKSSLSTHNNSLAIDACRFFGGLLQQAIQGESKENLLNGRACKLNLPNEVQNITAGSYREKDIAQISSSGFVLHTLEASLWAFYRTDSFKEAVLKAVNLGDDADTVGAVTGQLAGAFYGLNNIPEKWISGLAYKDHIISIINKLYEV